MFLQTFFLWLICSLSFKAYCMETKPLIHVPPLEPNQEIVLSNGFKPHQGFKGSGFLLEPLHRVHGMSDYQAWHEDKPTFLSLKKLYAKAWNGWPREQMTSADNTRDLHKLHYSEFLGKRGYSAYAYTVMDPKGVTVIGSLYIYPTSCFTQAQVFYWIVEKYRKPLETTFVSETKKWIESFWPYEKFNYPGPELSDEQRGQKYETMQKQICGDKN